MSKIHAEGPRGEAVSRYVVGQEGVRSGQALPPTGEPGAVAPIGSRLFRDYIIPDEGHDGILREVWSGTPWVADVWTDSYSTSEGIIRHHAMMSWLRERYGEPSWPFADPPRPGHWREGNATVCGWTWFGFDTEERMVEFVSAWPAPEARIPSPSPSDGEGFMPTELNPKGAR